MNKLKLKTKPEVYQVFASYPDSVRDKMLFLRELVIETAREIDDMNDLEETLK